MDTPLWIPDPEKCNESQMALFSAMVTAKYGEDFQEYSALHKWSLKNPSQFWGLLAKFVGIDLDSPYQRIVDDYDAFPGSVWFPGAKLNFAKNLLKRRDDHLAIVSILETGQRTTLTYNELYDQTSKMAAWLKNKIKENDRVAGWVPNTSEAIVSMLGTTANGGIWSSCSPDFGIDGALDRFGQIDPTVLVACHSYSYGGKVFNITEKVLAVASKMSSLKWLVWVDGTEEKIPERHFTQSTFHNDIMAVDPSSIAFAKRKFSDPLYIMYSSGTTGAPKCITHTTGGTLIQHLKEHRLHVDLQRDDRFFFYTTCGWMMWNWLVSGLASGATLVLYDGSPFYPDPEALINLVEKEKINIFGVSAKYISSIEKSGIEPNRSHDLRSLRTILSTGSPLTHGSFRYVYNKVKTDVHLASISGGTDILGCFVLGNPCLPVWEGEIQCAALGVDADVWDENGYPIIETKGELVCKQPIPSCPSGFWNDAENEKFFNAYFSKFAGIWAHGDYVEKTKNGGFIIHGRSDSVLNPGGGRIGTAESYRLVESFEEITESVCVGQNWGDDSRVILFVIMQKGVELNASLIQTIQNTIRSKASPRHVPSKIISVKDIPRTLSGKIVELAVRNIIHGTAIENTSALSNPEALKNFQNLPELSF